MTASRGIAGVSRALRSLIATACAPEGAGVAVQLLQLAELPDLRGDGVALVLLKAEPSAALRTAAPPRSGTTIQLGATPLELGYLLVPHAQEPERQQRLLGLLFQALAARAILDGASLNQMAGETDLFRPAEQIQLVIDPPVDGTVPANLPASIRLRVRGLILDPPPAAPPPPVVTRPVVAPGLKTPR